MGNCLKAVSSGTSDDISLLRESPSRRDDLMSDPPPPYQETADPAAHSVRRVAAQLSEEEQVRMAQRMGLIQHLPTGAYDGSKKNRECVICMNEFLVGETIRFLPCLHVSPVPPAPSSLTPVLCPGLPHGLHRRLAHAGLIHVSVVHGAGGRSAALLLSDGLTDWLTDPRP